jgi:all-trans-8'-apo-beta-carotenal 15,15'-oxygenase
MVAALKMNKTMLFSSAISAVILRMLFFFFFFLAAAVEAAFVVPRSSPRPPLIHKFQQQPSSLRRILCASTLDSTPSQQTTSTTTTTTTTPKMDMPWTKITKDDNDNSNKQQQEPLYYNQHRDWGAVYTSVNREQACRTFDIAGGSSSAHHTTKNSDDCGSIVGEIPHDLLGGTFYKVGGANFERNGQRYEHTLDGDGFVTAMSFFRSNEENDSSKKTKKIGVRYTGRFVETEYFNHEEAQDAILYRNVFGTQRPGGPWKNAFDIRLKNVANTNLLYWGGKNSSNPARLFALWEAGRPYELDPETLQVLPIAGQKEAADLANSAATENAIFHEPFCAMDQDCVARGVTLDSGGPLDATLGLGRFFTAHPHKVCNAETGEDNLVIFRSATNPIQKTCEMEFIEYDQDWRPVMSSHSQQAQQQRRQVYSINTAGGAPHDFAISPEYYCFFQNQLELENLPYILGFKAPTQVMQLLVQQKAILHLAPRRQQRQNGGINSIRNSDTTRNNKSKTSRPIDTLKFEVAPYFCIHTIPNVKVQEVPGEGDNDGKTTKQNHRRKLVMYSNGWDLTDEKYFPQHIESLPFLGNWAGPYPDFEKFVPPAHFYRTTVILDDNDDNNTNDDNGNSKQEPLVVRHEQVIPGLVMEFPVQDERDLDIIYMCVSSTESDSLPGVGLGKVNVATDTAEYWWAEPNIFVGEAVSVPKKDTAHAAKGSWILAFLYDTKIMKTTLAILDSERFEYGPICRIQLPHFVPWGLHSTFVYRT